MVRMETKYLIAGKNEAKIELTNIKHTHKAKNKCLEGRR